MKAKSKAQAEVPKHHPMRIAWERYQASSDYQNTKKWAAHKEHVDGSLWASFVAGWQSADLYFVDPDEQEKLSQAQREAYDRAALLARRAAQRHADNGNKLKREGLEDQAEYEFHRANTAHDLEKAIRALMEKDAGTD